MPIEWLEPTPSAEKGGYILRKEPELLPVGKEDIVKLAGALSKTCVVIFWGGLSEYASCTGWPKGKELIAVAGRIKQDTAAFFDELLTAEQGFYFLEADA